MNLHDVRRRSRRHRRVRTSLWVSYGVDSIDSAGCAESVSEGGLQLNTNDVMGVGTRLLLRIEFPGRAMKLHGEVTWAIRVPEYLRDEMVCGMGIRFLDPDAEWLEFFGDWQGTLAGSPAPQLSDPWD